MNTTTQAAPATNLIAVPAGDHIEVVAERREAPTDKGGRRKKDPVPAVVLAQGDDAPMPRATPAQTRAAKKKAEAASRIQDMTQANIDAAKTPAAPNAAEAEAELPVSEASALVPRETPAPVVPDEAAAKMLDAMRQSEAPTNTPPTDAAPGLPISPMRGLRERLKAGAYMKMPNGQPANGDEVATVLGNLEPLEVVKALMIAFDHKSNFYGHLNVGQQSMNYRNKFRGALKRGELGMGVLREAVEVVLDSRPQPAAAAPAPAPTEAPPAAPEAAPVTAKDGEPVANPAKVDDPDTSAKRSEASVKANASRTPEERSAASKKAAETRKANAAAKGK